MPVPWFGARGPSAARQVSGRLARGPWAVGRDPCLVDRVLQLVAADLVAVFVFVSTWWPVFVTWVTYTWRPHLAPDPRPVGRGPRAWWPPIRSALPGSRSACQVGRPVDPGPTIRPQAQATRALARFHTVSFT